VDNFVKNPGATRVEPAASLNSDRTMTKQAAQITLESKAWTPPGLSGAHGAEAFSFGAACGHIVTGAACARAIF
jgi:hypothetical protein